MRTASLTAISSVMALCVAGGCASHRQVVSDAALEHEDSLHGEWVACDSLEVHISELVVDFAECGHVNCEVNGGGRAAKPKRVALRRVKAVKAAKESGVAEIAGRHNRVESKKEQSRLESAGWSIGRIATVAGIILSFVLLLKFIGHGKH